MELDTPTLGDVPTTLMLVLEHHILAIECDVPDSTPARYNAINEILEQKIQERHLPIPGRIDLVFLSTTESENAPSTGGDSNIETSKHALSCQHK
jgi:hypothetical protein